MAELMFLYMRTCLCRSENPNYFTVPTLELINQANWESGGRAGSATEKGGRRRRRRKGRRRRSRRRLSWKIEFLQFH